MLLSVGDTGFKQLSRCLTPKHIKPTLFKWCTNSIMCKWVGTRSCDLNTNCPLHGFEHLAPIYWYCFGKVIESSGQWSVAGGSESWGQSWRLDSQTLHLVQSLTSWQWIWCNIRLLPPCVPRWDGLFPFLNYKPWCVLSPLSFKLLLVRSLVTEMRTKTKIVCNSGTWKEKILLLHLPCKSLLSWRFWWVKPTNGLKFCCHEAMIFSW